MKQLLDCVFVCSKCGSDKTYIHRGLSKWRIDKETGQRYCKKCWNKYIDNPKYKQIYKKIWRPRYNKKVIKFKGREIGLFPMRTGMCSQCGHEGRTNMHHWAYLIIFPWFATQELCVPCHNKQRIGTHYDKVLIV